MQSDILYVFSLCYIVSSDTIDILYIGVTEIIVQKSHKLQIPRSDCKMHGRVAVSISVVRQSPVV